MPLYTDETVALTLHFNKEMAYRIYENFDDTVEVLSPPEIRMKVIEKIDEMR